MTSVVDCIIFNKMQTPTTLCSHPDLSIIKIGTKNYLKTSFFSPFAKLTQTSHKYCSTNIPLPLQENCISKKKIAANSFYKTTEDTANSTTCSTNLQPLW